MPAFEGGRGKKAPYKTSIVRVPTATKPQVEALSDTYRELKALEKEEEIRQLLNRVETAIVATSYKSRVQVPGYEEAREIVDKILKGKQSARKSLEKLLQVLYNIDSPSK